jgi:hypothetical protein
VRPTVEWLRREQGFEHDLELGQQLDSYLAPLMRHLAGTFASFDVARALVACRMTGQASPLTLVTKGSCWGKKWGKVPHGFQTIPT